MQRDIVSNKTFFARKKAVHMPLRTFSEMAEEFGVTPNELRGLMAKHDGPAAEFKNKATYSTGKTNYYRPSVMREWWRSIKCPKKDNP
jgi:hypothetical protein